jgi:PAS domain S-box-containing protein
MHIDNMNESLLNAIIETLPLEITVIDANDEVVGWNRHENRLFKRPLTSMGANFRECHPEESLDKVIRIVSEMKAGKRDKARFWIDLPSGAGGEKHKILIEFYALRDTQGKYLGCMECTQDVDEIMKLKGESRLLDIA